ncbi:hypothetical protein JOD20_004332 [Herpetosiphon giganteus]|nr:hypothetical protein [Herpetosiphon giganteus]
MSYKRRTTRAEQFMPDPRGCVISFVIAWIA